MKKKSGLDGSWKRAPYSNSASVIFFEMAGNGPIIFIGQSNRIERDLVAEAALFRAGEGVSYQS
jgi:hypothetical protein